MNGLDLLSGQQGLDGSWLVSESDLVNVGIGSKTLSLEYRRVIASIDTFAATMYLWDLLLTLHLDVELVWPSRCSSIKLLYLIQRYLPVISTVWALLHEDLGRDMSPSYCRTIGQFGGYSILAGYVAGEALLAVRTWSAWNRDKRLAIGLITSFILVWMGMFMTLYLFLLSVRSLPAPCVNFSGCLLEMNPHGMRTFWAIFLGWSTLLLTLLLIPTIKNGNLRDRTLLYNAVFKKGTIYYLCIFAMVIFSLLCDFFLPPHYMPLFRGLQPSLHSMFTSKAILTIRLESRRRWEANLNTQCLRSNPAGGPDAHVMPDFTESMLRATCEELEREIAAAGAVDGEDKERSAHGCDEHKKHLEPGCNEHKECSEQRSRKASSGDDVDVNCTVPQNII